MEITEAQMKRVLELRDKTGGDFDWLFEEVAREMGTAVAVEILVESRLRAAKELLRRPDHD